MIVLVHCCHIMISKLAALKEDVAIDVKSVEMNEMGSRKEYVGVSQHNTLAMHLHPISPVRELYSQPRRRNLEGGSSYPGPLSTAWRGVAYRGAAWRVGVEVGLAVELRSTTTQSPHMISCSVPAAPIPPPHISQLSVLRVQYC